MISHIKGTVEFQADKFAVVDVHGIGYKVFIGPETQRKLPKKGEEVALWTHTEVRENALELYGFLHYGELELFEMLIGISGVGPKTALGVMAVAPADTLRKAIAAGDMSYLTKVSGIGRKTAEKIILELREKMAGKGISVESGALKEEGDVLEALMSLGYTQAEAREALARVPQSVEGAEKRIKEALKKLSKQ